MTRQTAVVLTTINVPTVLDDYSRNAARFGQTDVKMVVVGDRKTPEETRPYLAALGERGHDVRYLGLEEQERYLSRWPTLRDLLPFDSVQRRNIGYLAAAEGGADIIVSIDDDNIPDPATDYIGAHAIVGSSLRVPAVSTTSGWYNSCSLLTSQPPRRFYHRGFPFGRRWADDGVRYDEATGVVMVNIGLWLGDPDVDTVTRMEEPFEVTRVDMPSPLLAVASGTLAPFNSQNTAFAVELLPALFLISFPEGTNAEIFKGNSNFRYDDIWMSFFMKLVVDRLGGLVVIGPPHVVQRRNPHDYLVDLRKELLPMEITDKLARVLDLVVLSGRSCADCYGELIEQVRGRIAPHQAFGPADRALLLRMADGMATWLATVRDLGISEQTS